MLVQTCRRVYDVLCRGRGSCALVHAALATPQGVEAPRRRQVACHFQRALYR